jgi:putative NADH-flavin reductase
MRWTFLTNVFQCVLVAGIAAFSTAVSAQSSQAPATQAKPVKILLVGASGMIGSRILTEATSRGHQVVAAARRPDRIAAGPHVKVTKLDATDATAFTALAKEADVIVTATSPRGGGDPIQEAKAVGDAAIAAAKASGKRLIVVGGAGSLKYPDGRFVVDTLPTSYRGEALGMRGVLDSLKASNTNWTFFSPALSIRPGQKTGKYRLGTSTVITDEKGESRISAEDFAHALVNEIETPRHERSQMTIAY